MSATGRTTIRLAVSLTPEAAEALIARSEGSSVPNALTLAVQEALREALGPGAALVWPEASR